MSHWSGFQTIFRTFFWQGLKSKRFRVFACLCALPLLLEWLIIILTGAHVIHGIDPVRFFIETILVYFFQLLVPIMALFFGSSVISEEVDNRTLQYLLTRPVAKRTILLGKSAAYFMLTAVFNIMALVLSFVSANIAELGDGAVWLELFNYCGVMALAILSYSALFILLGTLLKRPSIPGILFIFGWENVVQYMPGSTQKLTLVHYVKSLLPAMPGKVKFLIFQLEPSSSIESIAVLLGASVVFIAAALWLFLHKEFISAE